MAKQVLTIRQALAAFGVSHVCLHGWRKGTPTKDPLPTEPQAEGQRGVLISVTAARQWAKKHGVEFAKDPAVVLASGEADQVKPGPKARAVPAPVKRSRSAAVAA